MHLAIDAVNIRQGGGITHLSEMLRVAEPHKYGFERVTVWSSKVTADMLPNRPWLIKRSLPWMDASLLRRFVGHQFQFGSELLAENSDVLFSPGGTLPRIECIPRITMSQNLLPFEPNEAAKFGRMSLMRLKMKLLRILQMRSFAKADGLIFLSQYAKNVIEVAMGEIPCPYKFVPHGIEARFFQEPRVKRNVGDCSIRLPFKILYVSILMPYKHQIEVAKAVSQLYFKGVPIEIKFVGAANGSYGKKFLRFMRKIDPKGDFLIWNGFEKFEFLHKYYRNADLFVFASSCENLPNILIEAMASGLAIVCSERGPMPEILGEDGVYFNPESSDSIAHALMRMLNDSELRDNLSYKAWHRAGQYSWECCANRTFEFIAEIAKNKGLE